MLEEIAQSAARLKKEEERKKKEAAARAKEATARAKEATGDEGTKAKTEPGERASGNDPPAS